jgi:hypothetical protein
MSEYRIDAGSPWGEKRSSNYANEVGVFLVTWSMEEKKGSPLYVSRSL